MAYAQSSQSVLVGKKQTRVSGRFERKQRWAGILFVLPSVLFVAVFFLVPLIMTAVMSLYDWPLLGDHHFIGLQNYIQMASDSTFWQSLWFTTKYTIIVTPAIFIIAFILALLIRQQVPGVGVFRTAYFIPVVIGLSTASLLWTWMFNDQFGIFDSVLLRLHLIKEPIVWLADSTTSLIAIGVMVVWKTVGSTMIFLVVGMNAIPDELLAAANVDGAGRWARLRYIMLPLLKRTFALALVLSVIGSYLAFDQFYVMTHGGPQNSTITVVYWIYNNSFTYYKLGYGSALSIILLIILIILSVIQLYLLRDDTQY